mgnify:CR=1 FL=1
MTTVAPQSAYDTSRHLKAGRGKVYASILDTIGDTPLVEVSQLSPNPSAVFSSDTDRDRGTGDSGS